MRRELISINIQNYNFGVHTQDSVVICSVLADIFEYCIQGCDKDQFDPELYEGCIHDCDGRWSKSFGHEAHGEQNMATQTQDLKNLCPMLHGIADSESEEEWVLVRSY